MFYSPEEKKWNKYSGDIKDSKQMIQFMRAYQFKGYFDIKNETEFKELIERKDKMMLIITLREDDDIE